MSLEPRVTLEGVGPQQQFAIPLAVYWALLARLVSGASRAPHIIKDLTPAGPSPSSSACPDCSGSGRVWIDHVGRGDFDPIECERCHGRGTP